MPMLRFLYRKMWNTRFLTLSTLLGLVLAVAFTTSIPMYADGALKRVVAKSLQEESGGLPAGSLLMRYQAIGSSKTDLDSLQDVDEYIAKDLPGMIHFPYTSYVQTRSIRGAEVTPVDPDKVDASVRRKLSLMSQNDFAAHVNIVRGRMYSDKMADGVVEAVVLEETLYRDNIHIGDEFKYPIVGAGSKSLTVQVVGAYQPKDDSDPYWYQGMDSLVNTMMISVQVLHDDLLVKMKVPLNLANWFYVFDLSNIKTSNLAPLDNKLSRLDVTLYEKLKGTKVDISFQPMLAQFKSQSLQLQILLFTLAAPMLAMVFYFIVMNSKQSLERQRSDIAVLRSRGGSTRQIVWVYILEGLILGIIALIIGPFLGWFMAKSIGSASGFLSFVDRQAIPVDVSTDTLLYGVGAVLIAIAASVIPAMSYAKATIVGYKQQLARSDRRPFWQRWFLDIVLIALAGYGWYAFDERQLLSQQTGLTTDQIQMQPLLFFVPALAIFALGLFFLRIFPWLLALFGWLGKRFLPVPIYLTLAQLSRSSKAYYPLMLLLVLTLGLGMYNSSAARTIDLNSTQQTLYQYGADVTMQAAWEGYSDQLPQAPDDNGQGSGASGESGGNGAGTGAGSGGDASGNTGSGGDAAQPPNGNDASAPQTIRYVEPPFEIFRHLDGVEYAARVLKTKGNFVVSGRSRGQGMVMGIDNVDFANVGWFRRDLYAYDPRQYLNLLGAYGEAALVSSSFAKDNQLKPGDTITVTISQKQVTFVIVGLVDYWPSLYPDQMPFIVANLDYIYDQSPVIPYEVWLKVKPGAKVAPMIEQLQEKKIQLAATPKDVRNELIIESKQPSRGGVFGILSLGFLVSVFISLIGYVLYWFFNLSSRIVQFGVLRAMGLSRKQLTGMLLLEQLFTAGLSIALGIGIGRIISLIFLRFLQTTQNNANPVPPFKVIFEARDTMQLYYVTLFMLVVGAGLLFTHIRRLRVHQAVKLGEER